PRARLLSVVERILPGALERAGCGDADERALARAARERPAHDLVLLRGEQERQRRRPLAEVDASDLPGLDGLAGAVEDVVRDLERDPEHQPELAEVGAGGARAEPARRLEELSGLQRAALEVARNRRVRVVRLPALHRLAAREAERRIGEELDAERVASRRQLGEGPREEVVARRAGGGRPVGRPRRSAA